MLELSIRQLLAHKIRFLMNEITQGTDLVVRWEAAIVSLFGSVLGVVIGLAFGYAASEVLPISFLDRVAIPIWTRVGLQAITAE